VVSINLTAEVKSKISLTLKKFSSLVKSLERKSNHLAIKRLKLTGAILHIRALES